MKKIYLAYFLVITPSISLHPAARQSQSASKYEMLKIGGAIAFGSYLTFISGRELYRQLVQGDTIKAMREQCKSPENPSHYNGEKVAANLKCLVKKLPRFSANKREFYRWSQKRKLLLEGAHELALARNEDTQAQIIKMRDDFSKSLGMPIVGGHLYDVKEPQSDRSEDKARYFTGVINCRQINAVVESKAIEQARINNRDPHCHFVKAGSTMPIIGLLVGLGSISLSALVLSEKVRKR